MSLCSFLTDAFLLPESRSVEEEEEEEELRPGRVEAAGTRTRSLEPRPHRPDLVLVRCLTSKRVARIRQKRQTGAAIKLLFCYRDTTENRRDVSQIITPSDER